MEKRELVVAPGKSKEATQKLHRCFYDVRHKPADQRIKLYNKFEQLLKAGADPNAEYRKGYPMLKRLSLYRNSDEQEMVPPLLIPLLVQYGAEIDKKAGNKQTNAFHTAVAHGLYDNYENAVMLLQCGADVNCKNGQGETPLHLRGYQDNKKFLKLLLIYGADPFIKNKNDEDAFYYDRYDDEGPQRRQQCLALHAQAQALLAFKEVASKKGERYVRNVDGKFVGKRDENGVMQLKTVHMDNLSIPIIRNIFEQAGFPYPHRQNIKVINVQVNEQSLTTCAKD